MFAQPDVQKLLPSTLTVVPTPPCDGVSVMFGKSAAEPVAPPTKTAQTQVAAKAKATARAGFNLITSNRNAAAPFR